MRWLIPLARRRVLVSRPLSLCGSGPNKPSETMVSGAIVAGASASFDSEATQRHRAQGHPQQAVAMVELMMSHSMI